MDSKSQELFDKLVGRGIEELSEDETAFLMGRRGYMSEDQKKKFASVIKAHEAAAKKSKKVEEEGEEK